MTAKKRLHLVAGFTLLTFAFTGARAQSITGTVLGTVRDNSGAVIQKSIVSVTNEGTNVEYRAETGADGEFVAPNLPPGVYTVTANAEGFARRAVKGVTLLATRSVRVDVVLDPGAVTQVVEVQAGAPVVNTENATIGNVMQSDSIVTLPVNGRTLDRLIRIAAGVTTDSASNPRVAGSAYWGGVQFNVDGITFNDMGNGGGAYSFGSGLATAPSIDAVSEFRIDSNNQKAEFEGSVAVSIVTKSGTNQFHGSLFAFNRNRQFAAKNGRATGIPKPPFNRNEFGFTLGGPVLKDRTFFFGGYEGLRERSSVTRNLSVPTQAMRSGDFAGLPELIDPLSGTPFPANRIPDNRMDPRARTLIGNVPLPNLSGNLQNYVVNIGNIYDVNRWIGRLDHRFSSQDSLTLGLNYSKGDPYFVARSTPPNYGHGGNFGFLTGSANITHTHSFSPRILNELRLGGLYHGSIRQGQNTDFNPRELFPQLYGGVPYGGLPTVNVTGYVSIGDYGGFDRAPQYVLQYIDNFTMVRGRHTIKAGFDIANYRNSTPPFAGGLGSNLLLEASFGRFDFNGRYTNANRTGAQPSHAFADFLLGYPVSTARSTATSLSLFYQTRYSAYIQDDWQVHSSLSLSFGVRYMLATPWRERDNALSNFDPVTGTLVIPSSTLPPQAQQSLFERYPVTLAEGVQAYKSDRNNFAPRFGFAWRPPGIAKTVVRGGAGVYYNPLPVFIGVRPLNFSNLPFQLSESFEAVAGATPSLTLANPFTGNANITANPAITGIERNLKNSESYQWNFTVERELAANFGVRASYVGNHTAHLYYNGRQLNNPQYQAPGNIQPRRPYQPWGSIAWITSGGDSTIHQLQLEAIQRLTHGVTFQLEYSWNRSLDNTPISGGPEDPYNNARDRGNSDQVRRHIFTAAWTYELPFGTGKPFANWSGPVSRIVSGWQLAGITYLRTGQPFSLTFSPTQAGWLAGRPDALRDGSLPRSERSEYRWFDPSAYAVPAPFTFGNSARNHLFGPGDIVFDISVLKDTRLYENATLQFRAEFFNFPNHANLGGPSTNISVPSTVGRITSVGDPRQIQFGLKLLF
jgi:hypothetical protein